MFTLTNVFIVICGNVIDILLLEKSNSIKSITHNHSDIKKIKIKDISKNKYVSSTIEVIKLSKPYLGNVVKLSKSVINNINYITSPIIKPFQPIIHNIIDNSCIVKNKLKRSNYMHEFIDNAEIIIYLRKVEI